MNEKVLFVDDDPTVLATYQRLLRRQFTVDTALGGLGALDAVQRRGPYAVVVADMEMPGMNGIGLLVQVQDRFPDTVRVMLTGRASLETAVEAVNEGNVFRFPNEDRAMWAEFLDGLPPDLMHKEHAEVLYFVGCVSSFSPAIQEIPQAFLQVLLKAGMDVALLAGKERCCGFPLIMGGLAGDAQALIEHNMAELRRLGAKTVVFNCPSCYYTWKKYYPVEGIRLAHAAEVIRDLVEEGRLVFETASLPVTYHDPCDLGRGLGVFDAPRKVLRRFASEGYVELTPSRSAALCCGGGGDVEMWDPDLVAGVNSLLTDAVVKTGAGMLVQGCPQCKRVTQRGLESRGAGIRTLDIAELALEFGTFTANQREPETARQEGVAAWRR